MIEGVIEHLQLQHKVTMERARRLERAILALGEVDGPLEVAADSPKPPPVAKKKPRAAAPDGEAWERARAQYEHGTTVPDIRRWLKVSGQAIGQRARKEGWVKPAPAAAA